MLGITGQSGISKSYPHCQVYNSGEETLESLFIHDCVGLKVVKFQHFASKILE